MQRKSSPTHPQGDTFIRKEDHCRLIGRYISPFETGKHEVKLCIPKDDLAANMAVRHNPSAMPV